MAANMLIHPQALVSSEQPGNFPGTSILGKGMP